MDDLYNIYLYLIVFIFYLDKYYYTVILQKLYLVYVYNIIINQWKPEK